jgi:hypothetical protein
MHAEFIPRRRQKMIPEENFDEPAKILAQAFTVSK